MCPRRSGEWGVRRGKFSVLIHVSLANSCVSKCYENGEWFGFGDVGATIFLS